VVIELKPLFAAITASLRKVIQHEYTILTLYDATSHRLWLHALDFPGAACLGMKRTTLQFKMESSGSLATPGADISAFADISAERFRHRPGI
jgi:hypothetical protein